MARRTALRISEFDFMHALGAALSARGRTTRIWRQNVGTVLRRGGGVFSSGAPKGAADLTGIVAPEGWRLEVECKVDAPHAPHQRRFGEDVNGRGGIYLVVRYDHALSPSANVAAAVRAVDEAIATRRARGAA